MSEDLEETSEGQQLGLTLAEASARLGLSENVIAKLIEAGRLKAEKLGKKWYIDPTLQIKPAASSPRGPAAIPSPGSSSARGGDPFSALHSLPDDHVIEIYRLKQGKRYYVSSMSPEEFSLRTVKHFWGGGVFLAIGTSDGQTVAQHGFAIDGPEKDPDNQPKNDFQQTFIPSTDPQSLQLQQLAGQVQALQQALMALAAGASRPQESDESRKRWLEEMLLMKQALAPPPSPPQMSPEESRKRWLEEIMLLRQVFAQPQQQSSLEAVSGALMKGVEMAATVSSIGEKENLGTALLKGMLPTLNEVIGGIAKNLITPTVAPSPEPSPTRQILIQTPLGNGSNGTSDDLGVQSSRAGSPSGLDLLLPVLKRAARENRDPYPYAAMLASEMPEEVIGHLRAATTEQFQQFAAGLDPQLSEYPGWVGELRTALVAELEEENKDDGRD